MPNRSPTKVCSKLLPLSWQPTSAPQRGRDEYSDGVENFLCRAWLQASVAQQLLSGFSPAPTQATNAAGPSPPGRERLGAQHVQRVRHQVREDRGQSAPRKKLCRKTTIRKRTVQAQFQDHPAPVAECSRRSDDPRGQQQPLPGQPAPEARSPGERQRKQVASHLDSPQLPIPMLAARSAHPLIGRQVCRLSGDAPLNGTIDAYNAATRNFNVAYEVRPKALASL